jgi:hypothetical protein
MLRIKTIRNKADYLFELCGIETSINRLYSILMDCHKKYEETRKYRDCIMSGEEIKEGKIHLLKGERMISEEKEVWNVTNLPILEGIMKVTNIRIIWYQKGKEGSNLSIPFLCIQKISEVEKEGKPVIEVELARFETVTEYESKIKRFRGFSYFSYLISFF